MERNFHVFYQLCKGAEGKLREACRIESCDQFRYLSRSGCFDVEGIDDVVEYQATRNAMAHIGLSKKAIDTVFKLVAAILHLGNVSFAMSGDGHNCVVSNEDALQTTAKLLGVDPVGLSEALTKRLLETSRGGEVKQINATLTVQQANGTRDALAKALYSRLFNFLVDQTNEAMGDAKQGVELKNSFPTPYTSPPSAIVTCSVTTNYLFDGN